MVCRMVEVGLLFSMSATLISMARHGDLYNVGSFLPPAPIVVGAKPVESVHETLQNDTRVAEGVILVGAVGVRHEPSYSAPKTCVHFDTVQGLVEGKPVSRFSTLLELVVKVGNAGLDILTAEGVAQDAGAEARQVAEHLGKPPAHYIPGIHPCDVGDVANVEPCVRGDGVKLDTWAAVDILAAHVDEGVGPVDGHGFLIEAAASKQEAAVVRGT